MPQGNNEYLHKLDVRTARYCTTFPTCVRQWVAEEEALQVDALERVVSSSRVALSVGWWWRWLEILNTAFAKIPRVRIEVRCLARRSAAANVLLQFAEIWSANRNIDMFGY